MSDFFGIDVDRFGIRLAPLMQLANYPIFDDYGYCFATTRKTGVKSSIAFQLQNEGSSPWGVASVVPSHQKQFRLWGALLALLGIPVSTNAILCRLYAGDGINHHVSPVPVCDDELHCCLTPIPRQHKFRLGVANGKISLPFCLLRLRGQVREREKRCDQGSSCCYPTTHGRKPCEKAITVGRTAIEFPGCRNTQVHDKSHHQYEWTKPVPEPCRLHRIPHCMTREVTTSDGGFQWSVAA